MKKSESAALNQLRALVSSIHEMEAGDSESIGSIGGGLQQILASLPEEISIVAGALEIVLGALQALYLSQVADPKDFQVRIEALLRAVVSVAESSDQSNHLAEMSQAIEAVTDSLPQEADPGVSGYQVLTIDELAQYFVEQDFQSPSDLEDLIGTLEAFCQGSPNSEEVKGLVGVALELAKNPEDREIPELIEDICAQIEKATDVWDADSAELTETEPEIVATQPVEVSADTDLILEDPPVEELAEEAQVPVETIVVVDGGKAAGSKRPQAPVESVTFGALPEDCDKTILREFISESLEYVEQSELALVNLETSPQNGEEINAVFRAFHTVKGTAGFLNLDPVAKFGHTAESLLMRVRDGEVQVSAGLIDLALKAVDMLKALILAVESSLSTNQLKRPDGFDALYNMLRSIEMDPSLLETYTGASTEEPPCVVTDSGDSEKVEGTAQKGTQGGGQEHWVRVRTEKLDALVDLVGELVIAQAILAEDRALVGGGNPELLRKTSQIGKIIRNLHDVSLSTRMIPLQATFRKLTRLVRDLASKSGKRVSFVTEGEDTEIDRNMVDALGDPLVHMIRNSIDHGIEPVADRALANKSSSGLIRLRAYHAGGNVIVEISDDGRGLDRDRILNKAISRGVVSSAVGMTDEDIFMLVFSPGLSTAEQVTELSGRGVGMDVVKRAVEQLGGKIGISSTPGEGTTFRIALPLTLAITDGMIVRVGEERYILPTADILTSFRPQKADLTAIFGKGELVMHQGRELPVIRLHEFFGIDGAKTDATKGLIVVAGRDDDLIALLIDELAHKQQVVSKPLGDTFRNVPGVSGGAILGDGRVGLILDVAQIAAHSLVKGSSRVAALAA